MATHTKQPLAERFFNSQTGEHYYTDSDSQGASLEVNGWSGNGGIPENAAPFILGHYVVAVLAPFGP